MILQSLRGKAKTMKKKAMAKKPMKKVVKKPVKKQVKKPMKKGYK